jgi:hypothetical protein
MRASLQITAFEEGGENYTKEQHLITDESTAPQKIP